MPDDWTQHGSLLVPSSLAKKLEDEISGRNTPSKGKFFSNYNLSSSLLGQGLGFAKPPDEIPYQMLTLARDRSLIDKLIINARMFQIKRLSHLVTAPGRQVGWRVQHKFSAKPGFRISKEIEKRCDEMQDIIQQVDTKIHPNGFIDYASQFVDMMLTYDRICTVLTRDRQGYPIRYHLVDPTTVRPVLEVILEHASKHNMTPLQSLSQIYKDSELDLSKAAYVQVVDSQPVASWTESEMVVDITNTSVMINKWAYGAGSMLEQSLAATQTWLNAWAYNNGLFNQDSPEALLVLYGDVDPLGLGAFQRQVLDQTGSGDYQKVPVVQADATDKAELIKIREIPTDIQFSELLRMIVQLKTAAYRAHPSIVNFSMDQGGGSSLNIGTANEEKLMEEAKEEGFESLCGALAASITRMVISPRYDDLLMVFDVDLDDETEHLNRLKLKGDLGMTFNESRASMSNLGRIKKDAEPGDMPMNSTFIAALNAQNAIAAQKFTQEQQKEQTNMQKDELEARKQLSASGQPAEGAEGEQGAPGATQLQGQGKKIQGASQGANAEHPLEGMDNKLGILGKVGMTETGKSRERRPDNQHKNPMDHTEKNPLDHTKKKQKANPKAEAPQNPERLKKSLTIEVIADD